MKRIENLSRHQIESMMALINCVYLGVFTAMLRAHQTPQDAAAAAVSARIIAAASEGRPNLLNESSEWIPESPHCGRITHSTNSGKKLIFGIDAAFYKCWVEWDTESSVTPEFEKIASGNTYPMQGLEFKNEQGEKIPYFACSVKPLEEAKKVYQKYEYMGSSYVYFINGVKYVSKDIRHYFAQRSNL